MSVFLLIPSLAHLIPSTLASLQFLVLSCLKNYAQVLIFPQTIFSCKCPYNFLPWFLWDSSSFASFFPCKMLVPHCHHIRTHFPHLALVFSVLLIITWHKLFYINCLSFDSRLWILRTMSAFFLIHSRTFLDNKTFFGLFFTINYSQNSIKLKLMNRKVWDANHYHPIEKQII